MSCVEPYLSVVDVWLFAMIVFPGFGILNIEISNPVLFTRFGLLVLPPVWIEELKKLLVAFPVWFNACQLLSLDLKILK